MDDLQGDVLMNPLDLHSVRKCHECATLGVDQVPSYGDPGSRLMIIGQNPGHQEVKEGRPFIGPSGELVDYLLDEIGLDRNEIYIANAVKCGTVGNRAPHPEEAATCWKTWLHEEIRQVKPDVILLLGKVAWQAVVQGRFPFQHNSTCKNKRFVFICSWHPSYCLRTNQPEKFVMDIGATVARALLDTEDKDGEGN